MTRKRGRLFLQISYASAARYVSVGLLILRGLSLAHFLGPAAFGVWSSMRVTLQFSRYAHLGARNGMIQHAMLAEGSGHGEDAIHFRNTAAGVNLAGALAVATIMALAISFPGFSIDNPELWLGLAGLIVAQNMWLYLQVTLSSHRRYALRSSLSILMAALSTGLGVLGAYSYGIAGLLAALGISYLLAFVIAFPFGGRLPRPSMNRAHASQLLRTGSPIMLSNALKMLMWNVDKLLVWILMGKLSLGIYALQASITNAIMLLPSGVADVLYPHILSEISRSKSISTAQRYLTSGADLLSRAMCPLLAIAFLTLHLPIRWLLPDYYETVAPGLVLVLATFFPVAGTIAGSVLVALGRQRTLLLASALGVAVATTGVVLAIWLGGGFVMVALGAAAGLFTRAAVSTLTAIRHANLGPSERAKFLGRLGLSFALLVSVITVVTCSIPDAPDSLLHDCVYTAIRCTIALLVLVPWTMSAWKAFPRDIQNSLGKETTISHV